ncbi:hypothetical protein ACF08O_31590 [Streptomyces paradoxus]|uniref:hypothetical protein n=1 Tax=Streptomyces paradoxus TaxID=66375 RepID=UPI0036FE1E26
MFDVLISREEPSGLLRVRQQDITERLGPTQSVVSRAIGQLPGQGHHRAAAQGTVLIQPFLAG